MRILKSSAIASCLLLLMLTGCQEKINPETPETSSNPTELQSDWQVIQGEGVSLALPPEYEGGNPSTDLDELEARLNEIGSKYAQQLQAIRQNPAAIALLAFDPNVSPDAQITNVNVIPVEKPPELSLEDFTRQTAEQLSTGVEVIEQGVVQVGDREMGRIVVQDEVEGTIIQPLMYFVPDTERLWIAIYATTADQFEQRLPNFEKSIKSFSSES
jgi:hypothetical protein